MTTMTFIATLESDTIISETSATAGNHSSLDYLPGACFLGACAARLYSNLSPEDAFAVFHSGKVRFGNAYPLSDFGVPALPVPAAWHYFKGESPVADGTLNATTIKNLLHTKDTTFTDWEKNGKQPKQMREGYMTQTGTAISKSSGYRLKTAIDRSTKRAKDSQLFGYESLDAGSRWWFTVECDSSISQQICENITKALSNRIRVGRSRTAENGIVAVVPEKSSLFAPVLSPVEAKHLHIYCFADLALREPASGAPVMVPTNVHFQLPDTVLDVEKSFIRTRRYAPFNGKRRANDLERQVICKGSVITFVKVDASSFSSTEITDIRNSLSSGVGMYRHDGLGKVLINPAFLMTEAIELQKTSPQVAINPNGKDERPLSTNNQVLIKWLKERSSAKAGDAGISTQVEIWANLLVRVINAQEKEGRPYPGNSQWGSVRDIASSPQATKAALIEKLFKEKEGLCVHGVSMAQWQEEFRVGDDWKSFAEYIRTVVLSCYADSEQTRKALYLLAERMPKKLNQSKGRK